MCVLSLAAPGGLTTATAFELPSPRAKWVRVQVGEVTLLTDARPGAAVELAENLQSMRAALGVVTRLRVVSPLPMTVIVFDDEKEYRAYAQAVLGHTGKQTSGVFRPHADGDVIAIDYSGLSAGVQVLYHELTHRFVHDTTPGVPLWLDEGLAELYSTFSRSGGKVDVGHARVDHLRTLAERPLLPLPELFVVDHHSPDYVEANRASVFYAESWAFVHYLLIGSRERHGQLGGFLGSLAAGNETEAAFRAAFGADFAALERELREYVQKKLFPYLTLTVGDLSVQPTPKPDLLPRDAVLVELGAFLSRASPAESENARLLLTEALKLNPANADAWAVIGEVEAQRGATEEATAAFEKALAADPGSFRANLSYAQSIMTRGQGRFIVPRATAPAEVLRARELFARSVELRPDDPRGYAGLGSTYLFQRRELEPGIAALEKALSMAPSQMLVAYNLVLLYLGADQPLKAAALVDGVLAHAADPTYGAEARRALDRWKAARAGSASVPRPTSAGAGARAGSQSGPEPDAPSISDAEADQRLEEFKEQLARAQQDRAKAEALAELVNAGEYQAALEAADEFLRTATTEDLIRQVTELREQLVQRLAKRPR